MQTSTYSGHSQHKAAPGEGAVRQSCHTGAAPSPAAPSRTRCGPPASLVRYLQLLQEQASMRWALATLHSKPPANYNSKTTWRNLKLRRWIHQHKILLRIQVLFPLPGLCIPHTMPAQQGSATTHIQPTAPQIHRLSSAPAFPPHPAHTELWLRINYARLLLLFQGPWVPRLSCGTWPGVGICCTWGVRGQATPEVLTFISAVSPLLCWTFTKAPASKRIATVVKKFY